MLYMSVQMQEKVVKLETEVNHIKGDVNEIKHSVQEIHISNTNIEKALVKLSVIAEQNEHMEPRITALEKVVWRAIGGISAASVMIGIYCKFK